MATNSVQKFLLPKVTHFDCIEWLCSLYCPLGIGGILTARHIVGLKNTQHDISPAAIGVLTLQRTALDWCHRLTWTHTHMYIGVLLCLYMSARVNIELYSHSFFRGGSVCTSVLTTTDYAVQFLPPPIWNYRNALPLRTADDSISGVALIRSCSKSTLSLIECSQSAI